VSRQPVTVRPVVAACLSSARWARIIAGGSPSRRLQEWRFTMATSATTMRPGDLEELDDAELLTTIQSLPHGDSLRDAACEVLVTRYRPLVPVLRAVLPEQHRAARRAHAGGLCRPAQGDQGRPLASPAARCRARVLVDSRPGGPRCGARPRRAGSPDLRVARRRGAPPPGGRRRRSQPGQARGVDRPHCRGGAGQIGCRGRRAGRAGRAQVRHPGHPLRDRHRSVHLRRRPGRAWHPAAADRVRPGRRDQGTGGRRPRPHPAA
jgi:hypothetical protein